MKTTLAKMFFFSAFFITGVVVAQNGSQEYSNNYNNNYNNNGNEFYDSQYNYPEDYYYDYPSDYYTNDFYAKYYNDYRNAVVSVNWDRFFVEFNLSPIQIREIRILNDRFTDYNYWYNYYRYNPDRWYYDRFITLERILGPRIYASFYGRYYNNYNPIVYYKNYRERHYRPTVYITPRYRNVDVFRGNGFRGHGAREYHQYADRSNDQRGFRGDAYRQEPHNNDYQSNGGGFRSNRDIVNSPSRSYGYNAEKNNNGGFRSGGGSSKSDAGRGFRGHNGNTSGRGFR